MRTLTLNTGSRQSEIYIGEKLANLQKYLPAGKTIILTDDNILRYYADQLPDFPVISIPLGEKSKTLDTLAMIFEKLVEYEADRSTFIVGIGGGIVCDVCGFAASVYMRGLRFGFVSTTLLSQVDASVGGKNGVNFRGYKNMIGVFNQPEFVICDPEMLNTLDNREFRAGFSEIIKVAAIRDKSLFSYLEQKNSAALQLDPEVIEKLIYEAVNIKASVVRADEKEHGERRILNFGHTFAHALEHHTGMLHGEAVSIGMVLASEVSVRLGFLDTSEAARIKNMLLNYGLPVDIHLDPARLVDAVRKDKKRENEFIHMVLLQNIGFSRVQKIALTELENMVYDMR